MDCDQVFMILTRGPFPTGELWDEEVEAHLETCADCWRLAEALRPALEVFQEAVPPAESRDLPGYWGDARPAAAVVSELSRSSMPLGAGDRACGGCRGPICRTTMIRSPTTFRPQLLRAMVLASTFTATAIGAWACFGWRGKGRTRQARPLDAGLLVRDRPEIGRVGTAHHKMLSVGGRCPPYSVAGRS